MPRYLFPKPYADLVARLRVPGGFVVAAAFLWLASPSWTSLLAGLPLSIAGLCLRGWAAGHLEKNQRLTTSGPYAWVRNPLYLGTLATAAGLALASWRLSLALIVAGYFLLIYLPVVELEEQYLRQLFPDFDAYAARVPMFLPRPPHRSATVRFRWSLYRHNREYEALGGFLAALAVLVWKVSR